MLRVKKEIKNEDMIYNLLNETNEKVDSIILKNYKYKKRLAMFLEKNLILSLANLKDITNDYLNYLKTNLSIESGIWINDDKVIDFKNVSNISTLIHEFKYNCFYLYIDNLKYKLTVKAVDILTNNILNAKREILPENVNKMLIDLENDLNIKDLYTDILFLALEENYEIGLEKASTKERQMQYIEEELARLEKEEQKNKDK